MKANNKNTPAPKQQTFPVSNEVFKMVYDAPSSLPGKHKWVTTDKDVRAIEKLMGMPEKTIGAPLWVSGDHKNCPAWRRHVFLAHGLRPVPGSHLAWYLQRQLLL